MSAHRGDLSLNRTPEDPPMPGSRTVLVSQDPSLIKSVEGVIHSLPEGRLEIVAAIEDAWRSALQGNVMLVLVHLTSREGTAGAERLLRVLAESRRPVATLLLSDRHHADQALSLLR